MAWAKVGGDERGRENESMEKGAAKGREEKEGDLATLTSDVTAR
jgi:hypothetical protein